MRRGQLEISFQWIFVLIAGAAFLFIFLFALRSCVQSGETRLQVTGITRTASALSAAAWYPQTNTTLTVFPVEVSCPAETLTISTISDTPERASLEQVPAFLSPHLEGKVRILTRDIFAPSSPPLRVGSVLYGMDDRTFYFILSDSGNKYMKITGVLGNNIKAVSPNALEAEIAKVPSAASAIIIASYDAPRSAPSGASTTPIYFVSLDSVQNITTFYERRNSAFVPTGSEVYVGDQLAAGAVIAGRLPTYRCAKNNFVTRTRYTLAVLGARAASLRGVQSDSYCAGRLEEARVELTVINQSNDRTLLVKLLGRGTFSAKQQGLYEHACPVIG